MKAILTSTGFDNKNIEKIFLEMLSKPITKVKALFVPSALTIEDQKKYAQCFLDDLLGAGIGEKNIDSYNLEQPLKESDIINYDVIYFSGGSPELLMSKMQLVGELDTREKPIVKISDNQGIIVDGGRVYVAE